MSPALTSHERIYAAVRKVPHGKVTTYGTIARLAGLDRQPRLVGYALSALGDGTTVPWHRVINAQGRLSLEQAGRSSGLTQRMRLQREGVIVDAGGRVSLARFGWKVRSASPRGAPGKGEKTSAKKTAKKAPKKTATKTAKKAAKKTAKKTATKTAKKSPRKSAKRSPPTTI